MARRASTYASARDSRRSRAASSSTESPLTPKNSYQAMHVVVLGEDDAAAAPTPTDKHFACEFDPSLKSARSLVLRFDGEGNPAFEEMSRVEILRLAQEAASPVLDELRAAGHIQRAKPVNPKMVGTHAQAQVAYGNICDVQRVHARDIRQLDSTFAVSTEPSIELRNQAILVNADPIRAVVMRNTCLVFVPDGADSLLLMLQTSFRDVMRIEAASAPYEFKALEALLSTLSRFFEIDYSKTAPVISSALDRLATGRTPAKELETLRMFKNTMNEFESQIDGVRRALMELLDNEEDLRLLYLTKLYQKPSLLNDLWSFDSEEAEVLVENYLQDIFSTRTKAALMQHRIQNTENLLMLKLDSMRNYLLGVNLLFSIVTISVSLGTFIAGIFGMNLKSNLEEAPHWFWSVTGISIAFMVVSSIAGYLFFRRQGVF